MIGYFDSNPIVGSNCVNSFVHNGYLQHKQNQLMITREARNIQFLKDETMLNQ